MQSIFTIQSYADNIWVNGGAARDVCGGTDHIIKNGWTAKEGNLSEAQPCAVGLADDFHKSAVMLKAILKAPQLQGMSQLSSFLRIGSYYQGVLPNTSTLLHSLNRPVHKGQK